MRTLLGYVGLTLMIGYQQANANCVRSLFNTPAAPASALTSIAIKGMASQQVQFSSVAGTSNTDIVVVVLHEDGSTVQNTGMFDWLNSSHLAVTPLVTEGKPPGSPTATPSPSSSSTQVLSNVAGLFAAGVLALTNPEMRPVLCGAGALTVLGMANGDCPGTSVQIIMPSSLNICEKSRSQQGSDVVLDFGSCNTNPTASPRTPEPTAQRTQEPTPNTPVTNPTRTPSTSTKPPSSGPTNSAPTKSPTATPPQTSPTNAPIAPSPTAGPGPTAEPTTDTTPTSQPVQTPTTGPVSPTDSPTPTPTVRPSRNPVPQPTLPPSPTHPPVPTPEPTTPAPTGPCEGVVCEDVECKTQQCNPQNGQCEDDTQAADRSVCSGGNPAYGASACDAGTCKTCEYDISSCTKTEKKYCTTYGGNLFSESVDDLHSEHSVSCCAKVAKAKGFDAFTYFGYPTNECYGCKLPLPDDFGLGANALATYYDCTS